MNEQAALFKPEDITVVLGGTEYRLYYDLNAFCELETIYDSVDSVLQMLIGVSEIPDMTRVSYEGGSLDADKVLISGVPLSTYIVQANNKRAAKHTDTRNLLWIGLLHDHAVYNKHGELESYRPA